MTVKLKAKWEVSCPYSAGNYATFTYGLSSAVSQSGYFNNVFSYNSTNRYQTFTAPCDGTYKIELWGSQGNYGGPYSIPTDRAGKGGYVTGQISLLKNTILYVYIGEHRHGSSWSDAEDITFNGGGSAVGRRNSGYGYYSGAGGGATDIRTINGLWNSTDSLRSRIIVAGAGGGGSIHGSAVAAITTGGYAGGITAGSGTGIYDGSSCSGNGGGKQTTGGAAYNSGNSYSYPGTFGIGANAINYSNGDVWSYSQGGGGAGWYGGGSGGHLSGVCMIGGGGGSSYISGIAGFIGVNASGTPNCSEGSSSVSCATSHTGYKFTSGSSITGNASMPSPTSSSNEAGHSGSGYARITLLSYTN